MGMLAAVFTVGCLLTGCGDSASGSGDAKYLLYKKEVLEDDFLQEAFSLYSLSSWASHPAFVLQ